MWVTALVVHVLGDPSPLEFVLGRELELVIAAVVQVLQSIVPDQPLEGLDVIDVRAGAKDHKQVWPDDRELGKSGAAVVLIEVLIVRLELLVLDQLQGAGGKASVLILVNPEHIRQGCLGTQPHKDIVAEDEPIPNRDDVPRDAVVVRGNTFTGQQLMIHRPKRRLAGRVEFAESLAQVLGLGEQSIAD